MQSWIMFIAGILLMTIILVRRSVRYYRKRAEQPDHPPAIAKASSAGTRGSLYDAPPEVLRWQVEMQEMGRDLKAELDTKMRSLQVLIRMADEATARLQQAVEKAD